MRYEDFVNAALIAVQQAIAHRGSVPRDVVAQVGVVQRVWHDHQWSRRRVDEAMRALAEALRSGGVEVPWQLYSAMDRTRANGDR